MGKKILFVLGGTGIKAKELTAADNLYQQDIVRIYMNGCHDTAIGGGNCSLANYISPDLDHVARAIRSCFFRTKQVSLKKMKKVFGDSVIVRGTSENEIDVDFIALQGFSRGAVSTFSIARHIDRIGIPIALFAIDPVVGESRATALESDSLYARNADLSQCKNLKHAEVIIGEYSKQVGCLHNKYFRQLVPKFSLLTDAVIYSYPSVHHKDFTCNVPDNHEIDFFIRLGFYKDQTSTWTIQYQPSVPKIIQQKHHLGVVGRTEVSPYLKRALFDSLSDYKLSADTAYRVGQALHALHHVGNIPPDLLSYVLNDESNRGKGLRDFIIEMYAIMTYGKTPTGASLTPTGDTYIFEALKAINDLLANFIKSNEHTEDKCRTFETEVKNVISSLKEQVTAEAYERIAQISRQYLAENPLTHLHLADFLDESETFNALDKNNRRAYRRAFDDKVTTGSEFAHKLYHSSIRQRPLVYAEIRTEIHKLTWDPKGLAELGSMISLKKLNELLGIASIRAVIKTANDLILVMDKSPTYPHRKALYKSLLSAINMWDAKALAEVGSMLSLKKFNELLDIPSIRAQIKTANDLIVVMDKLPTYPHRKAFYKSVSSDIHKIDFTEVEIKKFKTYLSDDKCKDFIAKLSKIASISGQEAQGIFDKLSPEEQRVMTDTVTSKSISADNPGTTKSMNADNSSTNLGAGKIMNDASKMSMQEKKIYQIKYKALQNVNLQCKQYLINAAMQLNLTIDSGSFSAEIDMPSDPKLVELAFKYIEVCKLYRITQQKNEPPQQRLKLIREQLKKIPYSFNKHRDHIFIQFLSSVWNIINLNFLTAPHESVGFWRKAKSELLADAIKTQCLP